MKQSERLYEIDLVEILLASFQKGFCVTSRNSRVESVSNQGFARKKCYNGTPWVLPWAQPTNELLEVDLVSPLASHFWRGTGSSYPRKVRVSRTYQVGTWRPYLVTTSSPRTPRQIFYFPGQIRFVKRVGVRCYVSQALA